LHHALIEQIPDVTNRLCMIVARLDHRQDVALES